MRCYHICNMYLSGIHAGIQSAHAVAELFTKYTIHSSALRTMLYDWANLHKTSILLNGGYSLHLHEICQQLSNCDGVAWAKFCESDEALDGAITNIAIIVPEIVYEVASVIPSNLPLHQITGYCNDNLSHYNLTNDQLVVLSIIYNKRLMS